MKDILILIIITSFISCKKNSDLKVFKKEIIGLWEIESIQTSSGNNSFPAGNAITVRFYSNYTFEDKAKDSVTFSGTYLIEEKKDCSNSSYINLRRESGNQLMIDVVDFKEGKMILSTPGCVSIGFSSRITYRRII